MPKRIITIYLVVSATAALLMALHAAVYVTFLMKSGLDLLQVSLVNLCYMLAVFLLEVPTGAVADLCGRKISFVFSGIVNGIGFFTYGLAKSFPGFILAEIIIALGSTLTSGALNAWLVDSLHFYNWKGGLGQVFRFEGRIINLARLGGGIAGAYLGLGSLATPFLVAGIGYWFLALFSYVVMKEDYFQKRTKRIGLWEDLKQIAQESIIYGLKDNFVFLIISVAVVLAFSLQSLNMFWQPKFSSFLPGRQYLGYVWAGIVVCSLIGNELVRFYISKNSIKKVYLCLGLLMGIMIICAALIPYFVLSISFFMGHEVFRGFYQTYTTTVLQENIPNEKRATIDSFVSMARTGAAGLGLVAGGILAKTLDIGPTWLIAGLMIIVLIPLALIKRK